LLGEGSGDAPEGSEGVVEAPQAAPGREVHLEGPAHVAPEEVGQGLVSHADELDQERDREEPGGVPVLEDDLGEGGSSEVGAALRVDHLDVRAGLDALGDLVEADVAALLGVVEAPVPVLLHQHGTTPDRSPGGAGPCAPAAYVSRQTKAGPAARG